MKLFNQIETVETCILKDIMPIHNKYTKIKTLSINSKIKGTEMPSILKFIRTNKIEGIKCRKATAKKTLLALTKVGHIKSLEIQVGHLPKPLNMTLHYTI